MADSEEGGLLPWSLQRKIRKEKRTAKLQIVDMEWESILDIELSEIKKKVNIKCKKVLDKLLRTE